MKQFAEHACFSMDQMSEFKIVLAGHTNVGKTCIVRQALSGVFDGEAEPTLGASFTKQTIKYQDQLVTLQIWDTAGQERYRAMSPLYFRDSDLALIVFSVTDQASFDDVQMWIDTVHETSSPKLYVVGNKIDLTTERIITEEEGREKATMCNATYFEVSALTGCGITDMFEQVPEDLISSSKSTLPPNDRVAVSQKKNDGKSSGGCC